MDGEAVSPDSSKVNWMLPRLFIATLGMNRKFVLRAESITGPCKRVGVVDPGLITLYHSMIVQGTPSLPVQGTDPFEIACATTSSSAEVAFTMRYGIRCMKRSPMESMTCPLTGCGTQ